MGHWGKTIAAALVATQLTLQAPVDPAAGQGELPFKDVRNHWASEEIRAIADKKVINGYPDGSFRPDKGISREELAKLVALAHAIPSPGETPQTYDDVDFKRWSFWYIESTKQYLPYPGVPENGKRKFFPEKLATREEVAVAVMKAFQIPVKQERDYLPKVFKDDDAITDNYRTEIGKAVALGIFQGDPGGRFRPKAPVTRAEMAKILAKVFSVKERILSENQKPPLLEVRVSDIAKGDKITVSGKTEPDVKVFLNGRELPVNLNGSFKFDLTLAGGSMQVNVVAINKFGARAVFSKTVGAAPAIPKLEVSIPRYSTDELITIAGFTVPGSKVNVNGVELLADSYNGTFRTEVKLQPGLNTVTVNALTPKGSHLTAGGTVEYDTGGKQVLIVTPATTKVPNILVSGQLPAGSSLVLNGSKVNVYKTGGFNYNIQLKNELTKLQFVIFTPWGKQLKIERMVEWQVTRPKLTVNVPGTALESEITVTGATEAGNRVYVNGMQAEVKNDGTFAWKLTLFPGINTVSVTAMNAAGARTHVVKNVDLVVVQQPLPITPPVDPGTTVIGDTYGTTVQEGVYN